MRRGLRRAGRVARVAGALVALLPAAARACPVCFGNDAGSLSQGARAAAFVLLGLTVLVLGGVAAFVLRLYRRQRAAAGPAAGVAVPDSAVDAVGASSATASPGGRS